MLNQNIQCKSALSQSHTHTHRAVDTYVFFIMDDIVIAGWTCISVGCLLAVEQSIFENWRVALNYPRYIILIAMIAERRL